MLFRSPPVSLTSHGGSEKPGKLEVGGASRDSTGLGAFSLEGVMLKLKLQYFGHLMRRVDSFEKTLMLGKIEGGRRRGRQTMR